MSKKGVKIMKLHDVRIWQRSDFNGYFGLFSNNVANILVLTSLLLYVLEMPQDLVFQRILPAVGLAVFFSSTYYFYAGYKLAKKEGRDNVTALPSGISVPHMFLIVFMIMLPIRINTGDPVLAWQAGIAWCFIEAIIEAFGAVIGPWIRRVVPRAALLGSLAGVSITYIMANAAIQSWEVAYISFASFSIILLGWVAKKRMPFNLPAGLVAIILGSALGWISGYMKVAPLVESFKTVGLFLPIPAFSALWHGFQVASPYLLVAIPMGIYNFLEGIDNLESASAVGDKYNTKEILLADGAASIIGAFFGNPVPIAVYIGHPGWKSVGARLGYTWATGVSVLLITWLGIESVLLQIIPLVALLPILVYIGIVMGAQAFEHVPRRHAPAVVIAIMPWLADWGRGLVNNAIGAAGMNPASITKDAFLRNGLYYDGMGILGGGAIMIGIIWGAILVFMMDRKQKETAITAVIAAVLTFFGIIHSGEVGTFRSMHVVIGYLIIAAMTLLMYKQKYVDELPASDLDEP